MELSNQFIEELFLKQMKEITLRSNIKKVSPSTVLNTNQQKIRGDKMKKETFDEESEGDDLDFYAEKYLQENIEDDEISGMEQGFMTGYMM